MMLMELINNINSELSFNPLVDKNIEEIKSVTGMANCDSNQLRIGYFDED